MDAEAQLANMREQMALMIGKQLADEELSLKSVWAVHSPTKQATWCPSPDCPTLGRKSTYDIILNDAKENDDGELEHLIMEGVDKNTLDELGDKVETSIRDLHLQGKSSDIHEGIHEDDSEHGFRGTNTHRN